MGLGWVTLEGEYIVFLKTRPGYCASEICWRAVLTISSLATFASSLSALSAHAFPSVPHCLFRSFRRKSINERIKRLKSVVFLICPLCNDGISHFTPKWLSDYIIIIPLSSKYIIFINNLYMFINGVLLLYQ